MTLPRDIPAVPQSVPSDVRVPLERTREEVQTLRGFRGDLLDRAVTWRDLVEAGLVSLRGARPGGGGPPGVIVIPPDDGPPDLTPPPTPTGLAVSAAISHLFVEWDPPTYTVGHGHGQTNIYGVQRDPADTDPEPVFGDAARIYEAPGALTVAAVPSNPNTKWFIWIKWESRDGVESVSPAGGTNGAQATTGQDVRTLLDALTDAALTPSQPGYKKLVLSADLLAIAPPVDFKQETAPVSGMSTNDIWYRPSTGVFKRYSGATWADFGGTIPFLVQTSPTVINGVTIPAGVYMDSAFIYDLTASIARLGNAWIDNAMVANMSAIKLTVGDGTVGGNLKSTTYSSGSVGWIVRPDGTAEFNNVTVRGTIYASAGEIDGVIIDNGTVTASKLNVSTLSAIAADVGTVTAGLLRNAANTTRLDLDATGTGIALQIATDALVVKANGDAEFKGVLTASEVVETDNMVDESINIPRTATFPTIDPGDPGGVHSTSVAMTKAGTLIVWVSFTLGDSPPSSSQNVAFDLDIDGATVQSENLNVGSMVSFMWSGNVSAGTIDIDLYYEPDGGTFDAGNEMRSTRITALGVMK